MSKGAVLIPLLALAGCGKALDPALFGDVTPAGPVCPGADRFEENDRAVDAPLPELDAAGQVTLAAGIVRGDPDFFAVITPRADPLRARLVFLPSSGDGSPVELAILGDGPEPIAIAEGSPEVEVWARASAPGQTLVVRVQTEQSVCTAYELTLDTAACSDRYEDDDATPNATRLVKGSTIEATVFGLDDDLFELPPGPRRSCLLVHHDLEQALVLALLDADGALIDQERAVPQGPRLEATLSLGSGTEQRFVRVSAANPACTPYELLCN